MKEQNGQPKRALSPQDILEEGRVIGSPLEFDEEAKDAVGVTMFDVSGSKDNLVTVLVKREHLRALPSQAMVEIRSRREEKGGDGRRYRGIVTEGPFFQPDGLSPDSAIIVTTAVNGMTFVPHYHGKVLVEIIGELEGDMMAPPRFRPLPNSLVFALNAEETEKALNLEGDISLGLAIGHEDLEIKLPSNDKAVLPRHMGILGTTGGGKSTTVAGIVGQFKKANIATILIDTEGEYTRMNHPTKDPNMLRLLKQRGIEPEGVKWTQVLYPVGRETTNPEHPEAKPFSLRFDQISPYAVMEILDLPDAQQQRYLKAYDVARNILNRFKIFPNGPEDHAALLQLDDLERGFPKLTLAMMYDIIYCLGLKVSKELPEDMDGGFFRLRSPEFNANAAAFLKMIQQTKELPGNVYSWRSLQGKLGRLLRLNIFDNLDAKPLNFLELTHPGVVTIIDLSDTDSPQINNLVIAELLRGTLEQQNEHYKNISKREGAPQNKVMVVIEEAHEFLSNQRIRQMPVLYQQLARIARRGRKRWLGLVFVTQLPQHLPDEVLTLINSYVLHKIGDMNVINRLRKSIGGVDDGLWRKLTHLSAGQAIVSTPSLKRALLVAINPATCELGMVK